MATMEIMTDPGQSKRPEGVQTETISFRPPSKGHAVEGIDYGLDIMEEKKTADPKVKNTMPHESKKATIVPRTSGPSNHTIPPNPPNPLNPSNPHNSPNPSSEEGSWEQGYSDPGSGSEEGFLPKGGFPGQSQSSNSGQSQGDSSYYEEPPLSYEEIRRRKLNALTELEKLRRAGFEPAKKYSLSSDLEEMEEEVERQKSLRDLDEAIKSQRSALMFFASSIEDLCCYEDEEGVQIYNIFDLDLKGWSESVYENLRDYDSVFEELYEKYKDTISVPPEAKLALMVAGSAYVFHKSRSTFRRDENVDFEEAMNADPELRRRYEAHLTQKGRAPRPPPPPHHSPPPQSVVGQQQSVQPTGGVGIGSILNMLNSGGAGGAGGVGGMANLLNMMQNQTPRMPPGAPSSPSNRPPPQSSNPSQRKPRPLATKPKIPTRKTRQQADPMDVDGLLSSLVSAPPQATGDDDEIDLSEMDDMEDLR
jgi:hypothetical protein